MSSSQVVPARSVAYLGFVLGFGRRIQDAWAQMVVCAVVAAASGCESESGIVFRPVTFHVPASCALDPEVAYAIVYATGDFEPSPEKPASSSMFLRQVGQELPELPRDTRVLVADVSQGLDYWRGAVPVLGEGPIDMLLWRSGGPCALSDAVSRRAGMSWTAIDSTTVLLAGGKPLPGEGVPDSFVIDLRTGRVRRLSNGLLTPRAGASITPFGEGAIVAGGRSIDSDAPMSPATGEVFVRSADGASDDFDGTPISLGDARADHGAVVMTSGETLLVGGVGADGRVLRSLQVIDPKTRRARTTGLVQLEFGRSRPSVLRLASGDILVAGGFDNSGAPVDRLEFLAPDARSIVHRSEQLASGTQAVFAELDAGGALAVFRDQPTRGVVSAYMISADGVAQFAGTVAGTASDLRLFAGAEGAPVLWTGDRWLRWNPWLHEFELLRDALGASGPTLLPSTVADRGLALWLVEEPNVFRVHGLRFATRGAFASVPRPTIVADLGGLAPDRVPNEQEYRFTPGQGLVLAPGAGVYVTDASFGNVEIDAESPNGVPPLFLFRDPTGKEVPVGTPGCAWPPLKAPSELQIVREGEEIRVSANGQTVPCDVRVDASVRISIGLRGRVAENAVRQLVVTRR